MSFKKSYSKSPEVLSEALMQGQANFISDLHELKVFLKLLNHTANVDVKHWGGQEWVTECILDMNCLLSSSVMMEVKNICQ